MENSCGGINFPPELLQNVVHLVHHLLPDGSPRLDRLEAVQQFKGSISTAQLPSRYTRRTLALHLVHITLSGNRTAVKGQIVT